jgi:hypothetical protein
MPRAPLDRQQRGSLGERVRVAAAAASSAAVSAAVSMTISFGISLGGEMLSIGLRVMS